MSPTSEATGRRAEPRRVWGLVLAASLLLLGAAGLAGHALAQPGDGGWAVPVNLSRGGAASSPAIVVLPNGTLRVLWWDQLEGLMVADGPVPLTSTAGTAGAETPQPEASSQAWSRPAAAPILMPVSVIESGQIVIVPTPIEVMPLVAADTEGRAQAFWLGEPLEDTGQQPLYYSRLVPGRVSWTRPLTMALPAGAFDAAADLSGTLHLAYVQPTEVGRAPSGLYYRRSQDGGASWSAPRAIHESRYLRLLPAEGGAFRLTAGDANNLAVTWQDPRQGQMLVSRSTDGGATWQAPRPLAASDGAPLRNEVIALPGQPGRLLWPLPDATDTSMAVSSGGGGLAVARWDGQYWTATRHLDLDLQDPERGAALNLGNPRLAFARPPSGQEGEGALAVVGSDSRGDLWITAIGVEALTGLLGSPMGEPVGEPTAGGPANLSHSGAASDPAIVAGPGGSLRAFWWDRFDGLMVADGVVSASPVPSGTDEGLTLFDSWSAPRPVPLPAANTPWIISDAAGRVHALWLRLTEPQATGQVGTRQLLYSRLSADGAAWSAPVVLADSILVFDATAGTSGALHLAYLLTQQTDATPAGIYYRRTGEDGSDWTPPTPVYTSRYLRLLTAENAHLRLAAGGAGDVYVTWDDPRAEGSQLAHSSDGGITWQARAAVGSPQTKSARSRLVSPPGAEVLVLWETGQTDEGACTLYQAPAGDVVDGSAGDGQRVLEALFTCPGNERFLPLDEGRVLMVVGAGSDALTLALWDGSRWSEPTRWSQSFEDAEMGRRVYLGNLHATLIRDVFAESNATNGALAAVGLDSAGDVWATSSRMGDLGMIFAPPSPWSEPASFARGEAYAGLPAVAVDEEGWLHVLWSEAMSADEPGSALIYARWDGAQWTDAAGVLSSADGKAGEPALVAAGDRLHAVWSGGPGGPVLYSTAFTRDAYAATGWREPVPLPVPGQVASSPDIAVDSDGTLHVVYAVPVNEARGIYYTRSADGGETWSPASQVLDASAAGWQMADYPRLAVDAQGLLHVAMVQTGLPGRGLPEGVYYAGSFDGGETWSEPFEIAEGVHAWAQAATTGPGQVHLAWNETHGQPAWWHRYSLDGGQTWSRAERVAGFEDVGAPAALVENGSGGLFLLGLGGDDRTGAVLLLSAWGGQHWSAPEALPLKVDGVQPGVAAGVRPGLGWLHVAFRAEDGLGEDAAQRQLWHTGRQLPAGAVTSLPAAASLLTATTAPTPDPTATPRPTAGFGVAPPDTTDSALPLPLLLAGVLAGLIVAGVLAGRFLVAARR